MRESNYRFTVVEGVLCIVDEGPHDQFVTVTNNAENVLKEIKEHIIGNGDPFPGIVIYRDSEGMWDGMEIVDDRLEFYAIQESDRETAIQFARERFVKQKSVDDARSRSY